MIPPDSISQAQAAAAAAMASVTTEDGRWGVLGRALAQRAGAVEAADPAGFAKAELLLNLLRRLVCPTASDSAWTKALSLRTPESVEERLHELRLAAAVANPDRRVAYHEAGHAVMARMLGVPLAGVSIDEGKVDRISFSRETEAALAKGRLDRDTAKRHAMVVLAGPVAERLVFGWAEDTRAPGDREAIGRLALSLAGGRSQDELLALGAELEQATAMALEAPTAKVGLEAVAGALLSRKTLTAEELAELIPMGDSEAS